MDLSLEEHRQRSKVKKEETVMCQSACRIQRLVVGGIIIAISLLFGLSGCAGPEKQKFVDDHTILPPYTVDPVLVTDMTSNDANGPQ